MTPPTLEGLLKWILTALAVSLALFLLGTRFYQGYGDLRTQALRDSDLVGEVVTRLPSVAAEGWLSRLGYMDYAVVRDLVELPRPDER